MTQRVTLRDVAQRVGVSVTTVSNVVRGWPYVADDTRTKVQHAIHELGYSPHPIAQGLRTGQMQTLGFIVPDLSNPYFASMVSVAETISQEQNYTMIVFNTHEDETRQAECIRRATNRLVDGILIAQVVNAERTIEALNGVPVPVVLIDREPPGFAGPFCVLDNVRAARLAMEHLCGLGHRRIAHLAGPVGAAPARNRIAGYRQMVRECGFDYERIAYSDVSWGCDEGYRAMNEVLADDALPTAIFASNDRVALGARHALRERGLRVPDDMSIVGVDDIEISRHADPPLTTVRQPLHDLARAGIELLLTLVRGETPDQIHHVLEPTLVVRESTRRLSEGEARP